MIELVGVYLGAFVGLAFMLAAAVVLALPLMLLNWIEERRMGRKYDAVGYGHSSHGCVRCSQMNHPPDAAGSAALARPASSTPSRP